MSAGTIPSLPEELARFLSAPTPRVLAVKGPPGSGKSALLQAIMPGIAGETVYVAYRATAPSTPNGRPSPSAPDVVLLLMQRAARASAPAPGPAPGSPSVGAPIRPPTSGEMPEVLRSTYDRVKSAGGGCVVADSWDRGCEEQFRRAASGDVNVTEFAASGRMLRETLQRLPIHLLVAVAASPDPQFDTDSDGIVELGTETVDGTPVRVARIAKLRGQSFVKDRWPYTLHNGRFRAARARPPGYVPPFGPPDDPPAGSDRIWPGSEEFALAFGWLRPHGMTGIELSDELSDRMFDVVAYPLAASALRQGGRVVWIPPGSSPPAAIVQTLAEHTPEETIHQGLRVLSAGGYDPMLAQSSSVPLPVRPVVDEGRERGSPDASAVSPIFPDAYQFLAASAEGRPALLLVSMDGLHALAKASGATYDPATLPLIAGAYAQLPRFHGVGFGRPSDPFTKALLPSADLHLRLRSLYGHPVALGLRPWTPPYLMEWDDADGRLRFVPLV